MFLQQSMPSMHSWHPGLLLALLSWAATEPAMRRCSLPRHIAAMTLLCYKVAELCGLQINTSIKHKQQPARRWTWCKTPSGELACLQLLAHDFIGDHLLHLTLLASLHDLQSLGLFLNLTREAAGLCGPAMLATSLKARLAASTIRCNC